jgi:hypothetical protein
MQKYDELWNEINTLLFFLRGSSISAVELFNRYFLDKFGNNAPGILLQEQIDKLQKRLNEAK